MADLKIRGVHKRFAETTILHGIDLDIGDGEFVVFVGPSGCGKSTLLRTICGLEEPDGGTIAIGGRDMTNVPPAQRGIAMVFQSYALYPHMTVYDNMAFALKLAGTPTATIRDKVLTAAASLRIDALLERKPKDLSGGQRQRVAIGRAIVRHPEVFLFDEPLSNLDAALRVQMRIELKNLHRALKSTMVYVTHDQVEAMTLADRIVVLGPSGVQQIGAPMALYERPANVFVAGFIGMPKMNLAEGSVDAGGRLALGQAPGQVQLDWHNPAAGGRTVTVGIRPEHLVPQPDGPVRGNVVLVERLGAESHVHLEVAGLARPLVVSIKAEPPAPGSAWAVAPVQGALHVFGPDGLRIDPQQPAPAGIHINGLSEAA